VTEAPENAAKLIDEGLNVARLNFSHGDHAEHRRQMIGVLEAMTKRKNAHVAFMLDTKGPEIRTGNNEDGKPVEVKAGELLELSNDLSKCSYRLLIPREQQENCMLVPEPPPGHFSRQEGSDS
jgi:pyruvate kinase